MEARQHLRDHGPSGARRIVKRAARTSALALAIGLAIAVPPADTPAEGPDAPPERALERCGEVGAGTPATANAGCEIDAVVERFDFRLLNVFGDTEFATCSLNLELRVDRAGRLWVLYAGISTVHGPCSDIRACYRPKRDDEYWRAAPTKPWTGSARDTGNGSLRVDLDACFDTCAGRFEGRVELDVFRHGRGWHMRADEEAVGLSGLELDGEWQLSGELAALRAAAS